ncbi:unnamed protein product [Amaranthus hypochondriacus]
MDFNNLAREGINGRAGEKLQWHSRKKWWPYGDVLVVSGGLWPGRWAVGYTDSHESRQSTREAEKQGGLWVVAWLRREPGRQGEGKQQHTGQSDRNSELWWLVAVGRRSKPVPSIFHE